MDQLILLWWIVLDSLKNGWIVCDVKDAVDLYEKNKYNLFFPQIYPGLSLRLDQLNHVSFIPDILLLSIPNVSFEGTRQYNTSC